MKKNTITNVLLFLSYLKHRAKTKLMCIAFSQVILAMAFGQESAKSYHDQWLKEIYAQQYKEAIELFDKAIDGKSTHYMPAYQKGRSQVVPGLYREVMVNLDHEIKRDPRYKGIPANLPHAIMFGATGDYTYVSALDFNYAKAYFNRAAAYQMPVKKDSAFVDSVKCSQPGFTEAKEIIDLTITPIK